jgi:hypothetical protein
VTGGPGKDTIMGDGSSSCCSMYQCKVPYGNVTIQAQDGDVEEVGNGSSRGRALPGANRPEPVRAARWG